MGQCRRSGDFASDLRCQQQQRRRALVNSVLEGADAGNMAQLVAAILTVLTVAWLLWQGPGAFVKRQIPLPDSLLRLGSYGRRVMAEDASRLPRLFR